MTQPTFRNPDLFQVLPYREYIRQHCPSGHEGFVVEDLDLIRSKYDHYTQVFSLDELKYGYTKLDTSQEYLFGIIDYLLRKADPSGKVYTGYNLINYFNEDWNACETFVVNGKLLSLNEFKKFLEFELIIPSYEFSPFYTEKIRRLIP